MIECRICLEDSTNEQLISPCGCDGTAKWVHESCLQRWREENVGNDNARRCEICNVHYLIEREHPLETYTTLYEGWGICGEFWMGAGFGWVLGGFMWALDDTTHYTSMKVFQIQSLHLPYRMRSDDWLAWSYYQSLSTWCVAIIAFVIQLSRIHPNINRKYTYYCKMLPIIIWNALFVNTFLFILGIAILSRDPSVISYWGPISSAIQLHTFFGYHRASNKTLIKMNRRNIGERILSVQENPLNYQAARRFEIEDIV